MQRGFETRIVIRLGSEQRLELTRWQRCTTMRAGLVRRGYVILLLAAGIPIAQASRVTGLGRRHVYKWAMRFLEQGIEHLGWKRFRCINLQPGSIKQGRQRTGTGDPLLVDAGHGGGVQIVRVQACSGGECR